MEVWEMRDTKGKNNNKYQQVQQSTIIGCTTK